MTASTNHRETGARVPRERTDDAASKEFSQDAATNKKPADGMGLTESVDDVNDKTRHSDNRSTDGRSSPAPADRRRD